MNESELIASLLHAVYAQHQAIDLLVSQLCAADPSFRPSQSGSIWEAVKDGHKAIEDTLQWERKQ
jgi:hypothetical protein